MNGYMAFVPYHAEVVGKRQVEHASEELVAPGRPLSLAFATHNNVQVGYYTSCVLYLYTIDIYP